jgi:hypothetical protein
MNHRFLEIALGQGKAAGSKQGSGGIFLFLVS